jgi:hypothetical protein
MPTLQKGFKCCLTCAFWTGGRELINAGFATKAPDGAKGKCANPRGFFQQPMQPLASCGSYQPWPALR